MKGISWAIAGMGKESFTIKMGVFMIENGKIIKWMDDMGLFTISQENC